MKRMAGQVLSYIVVGVISVGIDFGLFTVLNHFLGINYLLSSVVSFVTSLVANYFMSVRWVFTSGRHNRGVEFALYVVLNVIGLGLNTLLLRVGVQTFDLAPMLAKALATMAVMVYNFFSRKLLLEGIPHERDDK